MRYRGQIVDSYLDPRAKSEVQPGGFLRGHVLLLQLEQLVMGEICDRGKWAVTTIVHGQGCNAGS